MNTIPKTAFLCAAAFALAGPDEAAILADMRALRATVDALARAVSAARWPLPKYRDMLFLY